MFRTKPDRFVSGTTPPATSRDFFGNYLGRLRRGSRERKRPEVVPKTSRLVVRRPIHSRRRSGTFCASVKKKSGPEWTRSSNSLRGNYTPLISPVGWGQHVVVP